MCLKGWEKLCVGFPNSSCEGTGFLEPYIHKLSQFTNDTGLRSLRSPLLSRSPSVAFTSSLPLSSSITSFWPRAALHCDNTGLIRHCACFVFHPLQSRGQKGLESFPVSICFLLLLLLTLLLALSPFTTAPLTSLSFLPAATFPLKPIGDKPTE